MNISASTQWSFRPAQMPEEMFVKTFVGREEELNQIFSHINFNLIPSTTPENKKNMIIKAERGIGKTSLFLAIKYKLKAERAGMLNKIIPIFFNEQEDFNTAEKLILRIFEIVLFDGDKTLYKTLTHPGQWEKSHRSVKQNIKKSFEVLKNILTQEEKKLVLFMENFDTMVHRILRKKGSKKAGRLPSQDILTGLVKDPDILMICSVLEDPETPHDYGADTFNIIDLKPVKDFYELIIQRARYDNNLFLLSNKEKLKNKIKAFEYLTGGNTRLMVHLYECLVEKDINRLELMLNDMINKSTPLFEWLLEKFVDYESREILNTLARRGGNATIKEIANDTFNSENSVRTLLNRLRKKNFVQKINEKRDKSDIYIMAPMMFFIWYQKSVLQRKNIILDFFIHFVDLFFDPTELVDKRRIEQVYQLKEDNRDMFAPYFSYIKKYIEAGKFPLKSSEEKGEGETRGSSPENEKMIYELVRARKDDTVLQTRIHKALALKTERKLVESANLFRIAARGYLILSEEIEKPFYDKAEECIRRAIEIYKSLRTEPLETVRCMLILVEILSDTERIGELKLFAQTIIRIGKKYNRDEFYPYLGYAHKYLGFAETETKKRLELFNQSLDYFQKDEREKEQVIIILVNIGLAYKSTNQYETALNYCEKALILSRNQKYSSYFGPIGEIIFKIYLEAEDFRGGLNKADEMLSWIEDTPYSSFDLKSMLYFFKASFLQQNAEFLEAEKYLLESINYAKGKTKYPAVIFSLSKLIEIYFQLNKKEKAEEQLKELENIISEMPNLTEEILAQIARTFIEFGFFDKAISISEKLYSKYKKLKDTDGQVFTILNIGSCYRAKNDIKKAKEFYRKAIELAETNNLEQALYASNIGYAQLLSSQGKIKEAIEILENLIEKDLSIERKIESSVGEGLSLLYMQKSKDSHSEKNFERALADVRKGLKYIEYLSLEGFVVGFYFNLILDLIDQFGGKVYPFFKDVELHLSEFYEDKEKGNYIKLFKYVVELVEGKDFDKLAKDLHPEQRAFLALINERLNKDIILEKVEQFIEDNESNKAIDLLEESLKENKRDIKKLKKLAELYRENTETEKYFEVLKRIIDFYPDERETLIELAEYYIDIEKIECSEKILLPLLGKKSEDCYVLLLLAIIEEKKKNYEKAIKHLNHSRKYCTNETTMEIYKVNLVQLYLKTGSNHSIQKAEKILESIKVNKLSNFSKTYLFYFLNIMLYMFTQKSKKLIHTLSTLLFVVKDSPIDFSAQIGDSDLRELSNKKLKPNDFECLIYIERMMLNETPVEFFIKRFEDNIEPKMATDIEAELQNAAANIFKRIQEENITEADKIVTLCGSRLTFESLLYNIRTGFTTFTDDKQGQMISLLTQTLEKLPESYKWLVLDFCSQYLLDLNQNHQAAFVNSLLNVLKEKKDSDDFLKETKTFLQTAKNTLDATSKEKIKKDLIKIRNEGEK